MGQKIKGETKIGCALPDAPRKNPHTIRKARSSPNCNHQLTFLKQNSNNTGTLAGYTEAKMEDGSDEVG